MVADKLVLKIPKAWIIDESDRAFTIQIDDAAGFTEKLMRVYSNPNIAVRKDQLSPTSFTPVFHDRIDLQGVCGEMEFEGERVSETIYGLESLKTCKCGRRPRMIHEYLRVG